MRRFQAGREKKVLREVRSALCARKPWTASKEEKTRRVAAAWTERKKTELLNVRKVKNEREPATFAEGKVSWTAHEMQLYSVV